MRTLKVSMVMVMIVSSVLATTQAAEQKSRVDCFKGFKAGVPIEGLISDKSFSFMQNDQGKGEITLVPATDLYGANATLLSLASRFSEKIRDHDVAFNMAGSKAEGAIVETKRFFKVFPRTNGTQLYIEIQDQNAATPKSKDESNTIALITCASTFELAAPLQNKSGQTLSRLDGSSSATYAYLKECLKLVGITNLECPVVTEEEVSLPKRASRKLKPSTPAGVAGDDVSASVPKKSGSAQ